ncbi:MAG TPA: hypothetical protein VKB71_07125, partial [Rhizomicrobium sp.]|nr:hypothetical protein [Rhizomicrobium sp.]
MLKTPEINGCRIPYSSRTCDPKMRNVGVHPAFFVAPFDQMAYGIRHNGLLRPALKRAAGLLILTEVAPPCVATRAGTGFFLGPPASCRPLSIDKLVSDQMLEGRAAKMAAVPGRNPFQRVSRCTAEQRQQ